ncbi:hypothetical protein L1887_49535 [Cichorium endivia]|nr:hypothetical protein L1887_49535 [Cichorium endivia]
MPRRPCIRDICESDGTLTPIRHDERLAKNKKAPDNFRKSNHTLNPFHLQQPSSPAPPQPFHPDPKPSTSSSPSQPNSSSPHHRSAYCPHRPFWLNFRLRDSGMLSLAIGGWVSSLLGSSGTTSPARFRRWGWEPEESRRSCRWRLEVRWGRGLGIVLRAVGGEGVVGGFGGGREGWVSIAPSMARTGSWGLAFGLPPELPGRESGGELEKSRTMSSARCGCRLVLVVER